MHNYLALCLCLIVGFCEQPTEPASRKVGTEFELKYGETAQIVDADNFQITFKDLLEDSRCPLGTYCVWAGNAKVRVRMGDADSALNTTLEPKEVTYAGREGRRYSVTLLAVSPYPQVDVEHKKAEYVIRLIVTRKES